MLLGKLGTHPVVRDAACDSWIHPPLRLLQLTPLFQVDMATVLTT